MWTPSPYVLFRLAGKEQDVVHQLKMKKTAHALSKLHDVREWLNVKRSEICEELLFQEIGKFTGEVKSALVGIKRSLYNYKLPKNHDLDVLNELNDISKHKILKYCAKVRRLHKLSKAAESSFESEYARTCENLKIELNDENFLKTLQVAQPGFSSQVDRLLNTDSDKWKKQQRQTALTMCRYLLRMATKTSPFGRFGPIALGSFDSAKNEVISVDYDANENKTKAFLNHMIVDRLNKAISELPLLADIIPLRLNKTLNIDENEAKFLQPREVDGFPPYTRFRKGAAIPFINAVKRAFNQNSSFLKRELIAWINANSHETTNDNERTANLIESLIRSGMLIREIDIRTDQVSRLQQIITALKDFELQELNLILQQLEKLQEIEIEFSHAEVQKRRRYAQESRLILNTILGPKYKIAENDNIFIEDTFSEQTSFSIGQKFFKHIEDDVSLFLDCIYNRDEGGLNHIMFKDIFINAFGEGGTCTDINRLCQDFSDAIFSGNYGDNAKYKKSAIVNQKSMHYMQALLDEIDKAPDTKICELNKNTVVELKEQFEKSNTKVSDKSVTLHLQIASESVEALQAGDFNIVLNYTLPGYGRFFTRYCNLFENSELSSQIKTRLRNLSTSEGTEFKEVLSTLNHNAQVHPCYTNAQIELPGESSSLSSERKINSQELVISHNANADRIEFSLNGQFFNPIYMGFFHGMALPAYHRLFLDATPYGYHAERVKPVEFRENILPFVDPSQHSGLIRHYPRLQLGKLVIQRETWCVDIDALPQLKSNAPLYQLFKTLFLWHKEQGIPRESFIRIKQNSASPSENIFSQNRIGHKPIYFDFENVFSVKDLVRILSKGNVASIQFEEALPSVNKSFVENGNAGVTAELQIEFNRAS